MYLVFVCICNNHIPRILATFNTCACVTRYVEFCFYINIIAWCLGDFAVSSWVGTVLKDIVFCVWYVIAVVPTRTRIVLSYKLVL